MLELFVDFYSYTLSMPASCFEPTIRILARDVVLIFRTMMRDMEKQICGKGGLHPAQPTWTSYQAVFGMVKQAVALDKRPVLRCPAAVHNFLVWAKLQMEALDNWSWEIPWHVLHTERRSLLHLHIEGPFPGSSSEQGIGGVVVSGVSGNTEKSSKKYTCNRHDVNKENREVYSVGRDEASRKRRKKVAANMIEQNQKRREKTAAKKDESKMHQAKDELTGSLLPVENESLHKWKRSTKYVLAKDEYAALKDEINKKTVTGKTERCTQWEGMRLSGNVEKRLQRTLLRKTKSVERKPQRRRMRAKCIKQKMS